MIYTFTCPTCGQMLEADALGDDDAQTQFVTQGRLHFLQVHPEMPSMPEDQLRKMVKDLMRSANTTM